jgi:hypothetical protein
MVSKGLIDAEKASFWGARKREPGTSRSKLEIPGPRLAARPGMTTLLDGKAGMQ